MVMRHPVTASIQYGQTSFANVTFLGTHEELSPQHLLFYCRDYIQKDLINSANNNPGVVVLYLKPRRHRSPCIKAEYCKFDFCNSTCMLGRSGYPVDRLRKYQHTDFPSVQGPWTPWTHRHPAVNSVTFPAVSSSGVVIHTYICQGR
ncbi:large ribosomal subunit protein mL43-like [Oratosquilla oratoria]|uniref:large ribosomal subunit protein mL43-like n=1 Tax=Oratosquilla oratoria TaxID=337810 RepID=UPI003F7636A3